MKTCVIFFNDGSTRTESFHDWQNEVLMIRDILNSCGKSVKKIVWEK